MTTFSHKLIHNSFTQPKQVEV